MTGPTTSYLQRCLDRFRAGDQAARGDLLRHSQARLRALAGRMLSRFPNVRRWEDTDDVLQNALLRVDHLLGRVELASVRDYLRLAAENIRRELLDLARHHYGPHGHGAHHASPRPAPGREAGEAGPGDPPADSSDEPCRLAGWGEFHERVTALGEPDREVFDLLWYHDLTQDEAAEVLGVSLSTVKRRWQSARLSLMEAFGGEPPW
jgi:RNA polymerase sigma-70 factor (ECF subfamily)